MCGIVGYIGKKETCAILLEGLKRLEYRGYDSAGIAIFHKGSIVVRRCQGKLCNLENALCDATFDGGAGIGHTRWATHGRPSEANAHPHFYKGIAVVHNGIIENYLELKHMLKQEGQEFQSETDSEVLSHLFARFIMQGCSFAESVRKGLAMVRGSFAIAVLNEADPSQIIAARNESPLVMGLGDGENFVASDVPAILPYTRRMIFLEDGDMAMLRQDSVQIETLAGQAVQRVPRIITWDPVMAEKGGYKHFMQKEIFEQPRAIIDTLRGRISEDTGEVFLNGLETHAGELKAIERIYFVACGTSYYAGLVGKFMMEEMSRIPVEVDLASEFRYRDPLVNERSLIILISQSGETADTLAAMREGKGKGARTLAICNAVESSLARDCDHVLYTHAGPEIGVASTKAFTSQVTAIFLVALYLGKLRGEITDERSRQLLQDLVRLPHLMERVLDRDGEIEKVARVYADARDFLFLGRGINYPIALEGALKLKEISYIHAEGYPAGEMKHGPIALIDEDMPVVVVAPRNSTYEKVMSNIEEVKSRNGRTIALATEGDSEIEKKVNHVIFIPETNPLLTPLLTVIPLQLFAYHVAVIKGTDVDQPRNLAKSVTVE
ncbi:MAG: glutamine--fructose-6-phosphate transaminase (isomerizing) [Proteobacteria bacterium]|nr:glutamine--fructose-6-phosphate transaminase (isomerizing) [Pseudomonadota bacterium]